MPFKFNGKIIQWEFIAAIEIVLVLKIIQEIILDSLY